MALSHLSHLLCHSAIKNVKLANGHTWAMLMEEEEEEEEEQKKISPQSLAQAPIQICFHAWRIIVAKTSGFHDLQIVLLVSKSPLSAHL